MKISRWNILWSCRCYPRISTGFWVKYEMVTSLIYSPSAATPTPYMEGARTWEASSRVRYFETKQNQSFLRHHIKKWNYWERFCFWYYRPSSTHMAVSAGTTLTISHMTGKPELFFWRSESWLILQLPVAYWGRSWEFTPRSWTNPQHSKALDILANTRPYQL